MRAWLVGLVVLASATPGAAESPLEAHSADGNRVVLALGHREAALIVHFWASWCPECIEELPALDAIAERCRSVVRVAAVNVGESREAAESFQTRHGLRLQLLRDPDGDLWRRFARGLPANLIWTRDDRRVVVGPSSRAEWERRLASLGCEARKSR